MFVLQRNAHAQHLVHSKQRGMSLTVLEPSPSWEANSSPSIQLPNILCNQKVHNCVHKIPPLVSVLNTVHPSCPIYLKIHFNNIPLHLGLASFLLLFFFHQNPVCMLLLPPTHLIILSLIMLWSFSLCSFLQPRIISSCFGPDTLHSQHLVQSLFFP
jgi:hypothetical protein